MEAVGLIADLGVTQVSPADRVGLATPEQVKDLVSAVIAAHGDLEIGAHLHSTQADAAAKVIAAYDAGCRRFDSAIGGVGGCPLAQNTFDGNISTWNAVESARSHGSGVRLGKPVYKVHQLSADIAQQHPNR